MDWIAAHAEHFTALFSLIAAAWAFLSKLERAYRKHLIATLVTREDFARLESKVDQLVEMNISEPVPRRRRAINRRANQTDT